MIMRNTKKINIYLRVLFLLLISLSSLSNAKEFTFYDALTYPGKPDLSAEGLTPIHLIYEAKLTSPSVLNPDKAVIDIDKINNQAEMYAYFPDVVVSTDIEQWLWDVTIGGDSLAFLYKTVFDRFRVKNPNVIIGNYGIAPGTLNIYRYNLPSLYEEVLLARWKRDNLKRWESVKHADIIFPSVYIPEPNITSWINDLKITVSEIKKYAPTKKIVVYIWPQYYDQPGSIYNKQFISPEIWEQILEAVYENCDGAIIWSTKTDESGNLAFWSDQRVQDIWNVTKNFISSHEVVMPQKDFIIANDNPDKSFKIFSSIKYIGTPSLVDDGLHECLVYTDAQLSNGTRDIDGIYQPDSIRIATLANRSLSVEHPIFLSGDTWTRDRLSNNATMVSRFERIQRIFRRFNNKNTLSFMQVCPPPLSYLHTAFSNSCFSLTASDWLETYVNPTRPLRNFSDVLLPASFAVNDDTLTWKKEFYAVVQEAKRNNNGKPVFAHFYTEYYNLSTFFSDANKPIKADTWRVMMETAFKLCDGVVINSLVNSTWSEELPFWIATKDFIQAHENNIIFPNATGVDNICVDDKDYFKITNNEFTFLQFTRNFYIYDLLGKQIIYKTDVFPGETLKLPKSNHIYLIVLDGKSFKIHL